MTHDANADFWASNRTGEQRTYLSGDDKKDIARAGDILTVLRVTDRNWNDRKTGVPVPQWLLDVRIGNQDDIYTLTLSKNDNRDEFMTNLRTFVNDHGPMAVCLELIKPEKGNEFYVLTDPSQHPARAQQTLDLDGE